MHRFDSPHLAKTSDRGPLCIAIGLAIVLMAQLWSGVPIAAAIATIGYGATRTLVVRGQHELLLVNGLVYASLVAMALGSQFDIRPDSVTMGDTLLAGGLTVLSMRVSLVAGLGW